MADTILTPTIITREALRILHNNMVFCKNINREYDSSFAKKGAKIGATLKIRRPVQFTVRTGSVLQTQDVIETSKDLTVSTLKGVDWDFTDDDLTLKIDDFSKRYLEPAMARLASAVDLDVFSMALDTYNQVGTPGTTPASLLVYLQAGQKLDDKSAPRDSNRHVIINPAAQASTVDALKGLFQASGAIASQYEEGEMGRMGGFKFWMSQNVPTYGTGARGGTPQTNDTVGGITTGWQDTYSLVTNGWSNSVTNVVKKGDVFTVAGVNAVNLETKQDTGVLQQFVVTGATNSDGSGNATFTISPCPISAGAYQNVTAVLPNSTALTFAGSASTTYPLNLAFYKDAYTFVTADLELPRGTDMAARETYDGISMRFIRDYDITNNRRISRFDILYGFVAQRQEWGCRIIG